MRKKVLATMAAGALAVGGVALAIPSIADAASSGPPAPAPAPHAKHRTDAIENALKPLVGNGTINQSQSDQIANTLANDKALRGRPGGQRPDLNAAASALGLSKQQLRDELRSGKSLAQIATEKKVDKNVLIDKLVAADTARLDKAVKDGKLTQQQADQRKTNLRDRVTAMVDRVPPGRPGPGGPAGPGH